MAAPGPVDLSGMSDMTWDIRHGDVRNTGRSHTDPWRAGRTAPADRVTADGAEWLASAADFPHGVRALWAARPTAPSVLPCGTAFDVVNLSALLGRRVLERLWATGPGCGPVALHRGRVLLFAAPGTAERLPRLLSWEEWDPALPRPLCHGAGDAVTVPPLLPPAPGPGGGAGARWLVAPGVRCPWLPGAAVLLWACLRAAGSGGDPAG